MSVSANRWLTPRRAVACFPLLFASLTGRSGHGLALSEVFAHACPLGLLEGTGCAMRGQVTP